MTDDIVTRLRVLLGKCNIAPAMGVWSRDLRDAADEIERLRDERAARIDELVRNTDEFRETLTAHRRTIECLTEERDATIRELRKVEAERDEARRMYCKAIRDLLGETEATQIARDLGWDCFKEDER